MIKKKITKPLLDESGATNFFKHITKLWINPELEKRKKEGNLSEGFTFNRCLIKFPHDKPYVVEFNDEVGWIAVVRKDRESAFRKGDPVHIYQINEILDVKPPKINDKRVGFVFLHIVNGEWIIFFDFKPNHDDFKESKEWLLGKEIAKSLQALIEEKTILITKSANNLLQNFGLWSAPALISYPLSKIIKQLSENKEEDALRTLKEFCTPELLEKLSVDWFTNEFLAKRKKTLQEAVIAHKQGLYSLTVHTLLPQIEGIITDWITTQVSIDDVPWRLESKTKKFQDLILGKPTQNSYNIVVNSAINFILNGPVLTTFKKWFDDINKAFPNRHVIEHGKNADSLFNEENSIKLFLLIDTIHHIISERE